MRKAQVTYHAPKGDNKVVEMGGVTFYDGKETEINSLEHPHMMSKIEGNRYFDVKMGDEVPDEKPEREIEQTRDVKAGITEAGDHDFEKDRRDNLATHAPKGAGTQNPGDPHINHTQGKTAGGGKPQGK